MAYGVTVASSYTDLLRFALLRAVRHEGTTVKTSNRKAVRYVEVVD
jgi:hypothetical protein